MRKEAMITYNTLHSAKKNEMVRVVERQARREVWAAQLGQDKMVPRAPQGR